MSIFLLVVLIFLISAIVGGIIAHNRCYEFFEGVLCGCLFAILPALFVVIFTLSAEPTIHQDSHIIETRPLVASYSAQYIEGGGSMLSFVINTNDAYRYYYELKDHSVRQDSAPTNKATIFFVDKDYRVEIVTQTVEEEYRRWFLFCRSTKTETYYRFYVPEGSLATDFIFN